MILGKPPSGSMTARWAVLGAPSTCLAGKIGAKLASSHQEAPDGPPVAAEAESSRKGRKRATPDLVLGMEEVRGSIPLRSTEHVV